MINNKMKNKTLLDNIINAIKGFFTAFLTERSLKIQALIAVIAIVLGFVFKVGTLKLILIILSIGIVLITEIVNSCFEQVADLIADVYHPSIKILKDMAAGAVMLAALLAIFVGFYCFYNEIVDLIKLIFYGGKI